MTIDPVALAEQGKTAFSNKKYNQAADLFRQAAESFNQGQDNLMAAEMQNNLSVALLQAGRAQDALDAATGTDMVFAEAKDINRQAMAFGNQAAALEALKKYEEALKAYERSAELFGEAGETEMRSMVMQSAAAIKLRKGKVVGSALSMIGAVETTQKPTIWQRFLKFLLRFIK